MQQSMSCWQLAMAPSCLSLQEELLILLIAQHHTLWGNIYNSLKRKNIRKELWKAIFAHNSFYFYMTPPTPIGYNQNARYYGCCSYSPQLFIAIFFFPIFEFQI